MCTSRAKTSHSFRKPIFSSEAEGSVGARGAFEFFATLQMSGPPHESAAKKSSDETPTDPQPVGPFGEPSAAPPGVRFGIPAFAPSRYLAFALRASLEDPRRCRSTGLPLTRRLGVRRTSVREAEGTVGARGAFEFFATLLMPELPQEFAAKKSSDETSAAPQPGPQQTAS